MPAASALSLPALNGGACRAPGHLHTAQSHSVEYRQFPHHLQKDAPVLTLSNMASLPIARLTLTAQANAALQLPVYAGSMLRSRTSLISKRLRQFKQTGPYPVFYFLNYYDFK